MGKLFSIELRASTEHLRVLGDIKAGIEKFTKSSSCADLFERADLINDAQADLERAIYRMALFADALREARAKSNE